MALRRSPHAAVSYRNSSPFSWVCPLTFRTAHRPKLVVNGLFYSVKHHFTVESAYFKMEREADRIAPCKRSESAKQGSEMTVETIG
jgi:hypothetical protein